MEEQLPTPIIEIIMLNLYLGSVTLLFGLGLVALIIWRNGKFKWTKFFLISLLVVIIGSFLSMMIWANWNIDFDIMIGPFHIPTVISVIIVGVILLKLFGFKNNKT